MKRLLCMLCLLPVTLYAQDYQQYHEYINLAETQFVNGKIDSALAGYDRAFTAYDYIFVKDALIAAQVAWKRKDTVRTYTYLVKGAASGLRTDCLNDIPILLDYMNTRLFNRTYDSMKTAIGRNKFYNAAMAAEWTDREGELILGGDKSEFISAVQRNALRVKELLKTGIYPGEKYIGISSLCTDLDNLNVLNSLANYDCIITELHDQLWQAVKRGELHPREFATLWEWEYIRTAHNGKLITPSVFALMNKQHIDVRLKEVESAKNNAACNKSKQNFRHFGLLVLPEGSKQEEVNSNRKAYWITSMDTDYRKYELQQKEGYKLFWVIK